MVRVAATSRQTLDRMGNRHGIIFFYLDELLQIYLRRPPGQPGQDEPSSRLN